MEPSQPEPTEARFDGAPALISLLICLALYWILSSAVLWLTYDMKTQIHGGYYRPEQAFKLVAKMSLIVTALTSTVWFLVDWRKPKRRGWRLGWSVAWKTWAFLIVYLAIVLIRRQIWTPSQGMNDSAMFLPIVGNTNAQFLSEFRWLSFLIQVIPIVGLISAGLYFLRAHALQRPNRAPDL
jgi:hypothetical protein